MLPNARGLRRRQRCRLDELGERLRLVGEISFRDRNVDGGGGGQFASNNQRCADASSRRVMPPSLVPSWRLGGTRSSVDADVAGLPLRRGRATRACSRTARDRDRLLARHACRRYSAMSAIV